MAEFNHNLNSLFKQFSKFYPELKEYKGYDFLEDYCTDSAKPNKTNQYHYGYNSLKWIVYSLREHVFKEEIERLFKNLVFQFFLLDKTPHDLQYNIANFPESSYYKDLLEERSDSWKKALKNLNETKVGPFPVIINTTGHNLTNKIFNLYNPEIIIAANNQAGKKAIIFKEYGYLANNEQSIVSNIYLDLCKQEGGWSGVERNNSFNLLINNESNLSDKDLLNIIEKHINTLTNDNET